MVLKRNKEGTETVCKDENCHGNCNVCGGEGHLQESLAQAYALLDSAKECAQFKISIDVSPSNNKFYGCGLYSLSSGCNLIFFVEVSSSLQSSFSPEIVCMWYPVCDYTLPLLISLSHALGLFLSLLTLSMHVGYSSQSVCVCVCVPWSQELLEC